MFYLFILGGILVKKLLLFLALWSGAACAMQSEQNQMNQVATEIAKQSSQLTPEERKQAVEQATKNVKEIVDACGNDKELLKATLSQRIKNLLMHPVAGSFIVAAVACLEVALLIVAMYALAQGINFVAAIAFGKQMLITKWFSQTTWLLLLGYKIGVSIGWLLGIQHKTDGAIAAKVTA